jgi:acyl-CoA thioesterase-1
LLICVFLVSCDSDGNDALPPAASTPAYDGVIVAMGDSLTAGLGVALPRSYPALLEKKLQQTGANYRVINAGISGETSSGARARIDWIINSKPDLVIVETGANDGFRGISVEVLRQNLEAIVEALLAEDITVVLVGMRMVTNLGSEYQHRFDSVYPEIAGRYPVVFMPFFLDGVAMQAELNQEDAIHPNERGYQIIVDNLFPYVIQALELKNK